MTFRAVVFDLGGVVLSSPLAILRQVEAAHRIPPGTITAHVGSLGQRSAWHALETGRLSIADFIPAFEAELATAGWVLSVAELMVAIERDTSVRPVMVEGLARLRRAGVTLAALTNNWKPFPAMDDLRGLFDVIVESVEEGVNKPDERIYDVLLRRLGLSAQTIVYLDDIGRNLKPARQRGMTTIKVEDPTAALRQLGQLLHLDLV